MPDPKWTIPLYHLPAFFASFDVPEEPHGAMPRHDRGAATAKAFTPAVRIWSQHPAGIRYCHCPQCLLTINLNNTPSATEHEECVEVDDHVNGHEAPGFTTLGPQFPLAYATGAVYVSEPVLRRAGRDVTGYTTSEPDHVAIVQRMADGTTRHYHGFVAIQFPQAGGESSSSLWLVYHPGSGTPKAGRAPRKLFISEDHILARCYIPAALRRETPKAASADIVYLEQTYIEQVAQLEIPKKPSTAGALEAKVTVATHEEPAPEPYGDHLNVVGATSYGELDAIKIALQRNYLRLGDGDTLFDALKRYSERSGVNLEQFKSIDLIGHTRGADHVLKLGEFTLTSRNTAAEFRQLVDSGVLARFECVDSIRLLGCQTACSPRARRVVATIKAICEEYKEYKVVASRADLYAVHFDGLGLRDVAEPLLVYDDVVTGPGPGDPPPGSDRPLPAPPDDDEDDDDIGLPPSAVPPPSRFDFGALSDMNAPATGARQFIYWSSASEHFANLQALLHTEWPVKAKALHRADYEVLVPIELQPTSIDGFRSFDIVRGDPHHDPPAVRVYASDGAAYAFRFRKTRWDQVVEDLASPDVGIDLGVVRSLPDGASAAQRAASITQRKPSP